MKNEKGKYNFLKNNTMSQIILLVDLQKEAAAVGQPSGVFHRA